MLRGFKQAGKASFVIGGQWGSEAKGAAAAWIAETLIDEPFDVYTTNAGAQAGHTAILPDGRKLVSFHLSTAAVVEYALTGRSRPCFINAGAVIDPAVFRQEVEEHFDPRYVLIHPMAAVITDECREASMHPDSANTKIAGVRKGVGHAIAARAMRTGMVAKDHPYLQQFVLGDRPSSYLDGCLDAGYSVLVEVPQGVSLSLTHSGFYPYTTSRDCTVMTAMADAAIHPRYYGKTMLVLRTFPIRVGNIVENGQMLGYSGDIYPDQRETYWSELGVEAEITTVSKRVRRVFTFSREQLRQTLDLTHPDIVFLTFCNYCEQEQLDAIIETVVEEMREGDRWWQLFVQSGPKSADVEVFNGIVRED